MGGGRALYTRHIEWAIDFMEDRLFEAVDLPACARASGYSMYHFVRIFAQATGMTPMAYLRRRRIAEAVRLMERGVTIQAAAERCGFGYAQSFSRAFKQEHGVLPTDYVRTSNSLRLFERLDLRLREEARKSTLPLPRFETLPDFALHAVAFTGDPKRCLQEIPIFWNTYHTRGLGRALSPEPPAMRMDYGVRRDEGARLVYWIGVRAAPGMPQDLLIPESAYAVFDTSPADSLTFVATIHATWESILTRWLPHSGCVPGQGSSFERYCEAERSFSESICLSIGGIPHEENPGRIVEPKS